MENQNFEKIFANFSKGVKWCDHILGVIMENEPKFQLNAHNFLFSSGFSEVQTWLLFLLMTP